MMSFTYVLHRFTLFAQDKVENCDPSSGGSNCVTTFPEVSAGSNQITTALTIVFGVIGAMAVIYMLLAALKFITSQGDPQGTSQARQSIIYGAIGLAIAVTAEAIINLVLKRI